MFRKGFYAFSSKSQVLELPIPTPPTARLEREDGQRSMPHLRPLSALKKAAWVWMSRLDRVFFFVFLGG